jgi:hypothetical protein
MQVLRVGERRGCNNGEAEDNLGEDMTARADELMW